VYRWPGYGSLAIIGLNSFFVKARNVCVRTLPADPSAAPNAAELSSSGASMNRNNVVVAERPINLLHLTAKTFRHFRRLTGPLRAVLTERIP